MPLRISGKIYSFQKSHFFPGNLLYSVLVSACIYDICDNIFSIFIFKRRDIFFYSLPNSSNQSIPL